MKKIVQRDARKSGLIKRSFDETRVVVTIIAGFVQIILRIGFIVTNSKLPAGKVVKVCNGRSDVECSDVPDPFACREIL